jgi:2-keto-3-deoxy-L-rhamnonate aldolase RhmA
VPVLRAWETAAPGGYADFAGKNAMVIAIIEQTQAVENVENIAAVPGIDCIFIGPSGLSYSMGFRGRRDKPKLKEAIAKVVAAAKKHNISVGRPLGSAAQAEQLIKVGFQFSQGASGLGLIAAGAWLILAGLGKEIGRKERSLY